MYAFDTTSSSVQVSSMTQSCVALRPTVPLGQPAHRGPVSRYVHSDAVHTPRTSMLRPQDERTTLGSQCADNTARLSGSNIASVDCQTPMSRSSRTRCQRSSKSLALATPGEHLLLFSRPDCRCSPERDRRPALSPVSAKLLATYSVSSFKDH